MPVYYFIFGWTVFWGCIANMTARHIQIRENIYKQRINILIGIIAFSAVIIFSGLRSGVADTPVYISQFEGFPVGFSRIGEFLKDSDDPGFVIFSVFIKTYISTDYNVWLFIIAAISGISVLIGFYQYSSNFALSCFMFIASSQFTWMFNGIRQYMVVCILFACMSFIYRRKILNYIILVILLSTVHKTAIVMIPIYFIVYGEPWNKRTVLIIFIILLCMLFASNTLNIFDTIMQQSDYAVGYNEFKKNDDGVNIFTILISLVPVLLSFFTKNTIKDKYTPQIKISINMSIIAVCIYIISKLTHSGILVGRMATYFSIYNFILLPWLIDNIFEKNERRLIKYVMIVCYIVLFYYQMEIAWGGYIYISEILNLKYH
ncbi:MAG: EpsG family protein [Intestinibacter bartlettii]|uniref:EpsG family protein n=1 Tax=Intestinibacter bartlettii TaxID=261299 RepID=UPI002910E3B5|nr:EpsG family protein [Intestinibacter bartlettii]MDU6198518.1 EpsG family protein [Intestinibacter bartlettii]